MGWWILFGLIALGLCIFWLVTDEFGWFGFIGAFIGMQFIAFVAMLLVCLMSGAIMTATVPLKEARVEKPIYALADNNAISGSFFLGSGYVDEDLQYYYVEDTGLGKHVTSVTAERSYIVDSNIPTLTVVFYDWENKAYDWLGMCLKKNDYIFAIPAGSIISNYSIDLQ